MPDNQDQILTLIRKVDSEYKTNPIYSALTYELGSAFVLVMFVYAIFVFYIVQNKNDFGTIVTLTIPFFALLFTFFAFTERARDRVHAERNYNLILVNYDKKSVFEKGKVWLGLFFGTKLPQDALLKAIVRIKAKNPELKLEELYQKQPSLFTEKKLIESLLTK